MKNRVLTFIIGILTGAIIMTLVFIIFNKSVHNIDDRPFNMSDEFEKLNENRYPLEKSNDIN